MARLPLVLDGDEEFRCQIVARHDLVWDDLRTGTEHGRPEMPLHPALPDHPLASHFVVLVALVGVPLQVGNPRPSAGLAARPSAP